MGGFPLAHGPPCGSVSGGWVGGWVGPAGPRWRRRGGGGGGGGLEWGGGGEACDMNAAMMHAKQLTKLLILG